MRSGGGPLTHRVEGAGLGASIVMRGLDRASMPLRRGETTERGLPRAAGWSKLGPPGEIPRARAFGEDGRVVHREGGGFEPGEQPE